MPDLPTESLCNSEEHGKTKFLILKSTFLIVYVHAF